MNVGYYCATLPCTSECYTAQLTTPYYCLVLHSTVYYNFMLHSGAYYHSILLSTAESCMQTKYSCLEAAVYLVQLGSETCDYP